MRSGQPRPSKAPGNRPPRPAMVRRFAATARERLRITGGGYRGDHLRALAQRVEVADGEVCITGSKSDLLRTLAAASGVKSATLGVRSSVPKWRARQDSNLWPLPSEGSPLGLRALARRCTRLWRSSKLLGF